jgi:deoxycytidylate deaminase
MHKTCIGLKDCAIYTTFFPCNECVKIVIQAGIKKIYYLMDDKPEKLYMKSSRKLLEMAGYKFIPQPQTAADCEKYNSNIA